MALKLLLAATPLHRRIAPGLRICQLHRLVEQLETLHLLDGRRRALDRVKHYEGLALCLEVGFGDNVNDGAVFGEQLGEGLDQLRGLDALFEVADVDARFG